MAALDAVGTTLVSLGPSVVVAATTDRLTLAGIAALFAAGAGAGAGARRRSEGLGAAAVWALAAAGATVAALPVGIDRRWPLLVGAGAALAVGFRTVPRFRRADLARGARGALSVFALGACLAPDDVAGPQRGRR